MVFMIATGILFAVLSGICNGLFTTPMKQETHWKWENIWFLFIVTACLVMPWVIVLPATPDWRQVFASSPPGAVSAALGFGFLWGFGAICFGLSVDRLGVSIANTLVIGLSSAVGSLVPLLMSGKFHAGTREYVLFAGVLSFLLGVMLCGRAGWLRDSSKQQAAKASPAGYFFAIGSGVMSAVFNIGYSLALPIADQGVAMGHSRFASTNCIWLLMLGAGSIPNMIYCAFLMMRNHTGGLFLTSGVASSWIRSVLMGLLWGGSIFLYGAATPRLGDIGPSIGWPLSLAAGLLVANLMGVMLGEWRNVHSGAARRMHAGLAILLIAIALCALSSRVGA